MNNDCAKPDIDKIVSMYLNDKMSVNSISKLCNISWKATKQILVDSGIEVKRKRKYEISEEYFDNIDTQNKAYILGFLYADGSNNPDKSTVSMSLQEDDYNILETIRNEIKDGRPLEYLDYSNKHDFGYNYKNQYRLLIYSKHICNQLSELGMVKNKSLNLKFPECLDGELWRHFIRGYYDGDGSLYRYKKDNHDNIVITITSTNDFCDAINKICFDNLGIRFGKYDASCHNGVTKVLSMCGKNVCKKFLDWLYEDAELYMQRKYDRFCDYYNINSQVLA